MKYTVYFTGQIEMEASNVSEAHQEVYGQLQSFCSDFEITEVEESFY